MCSPSAHHRHREMMASSGTGRGAEQTLSRALPSNPDLLASDDERNQVIQLLQRHTGEGRLTVDEFSDRVDEVYRARTVGELRPTLRNLPPIVEARPAAARPRRRFTLTPFLAVAFMLVGIWAISGFGYFWPVWPLGFMALSAARRGRRHYQYH